MKFSKCKVCLKKTLHVLTWFYSAGQRHFWSTYFFIPQTLVCIIKQFDLSFIFQGCELQLNLILLKVFPQLYFGFWGHDSSQTNKMFLIKVYIKNLYN